MIVRLWRHRWQRAHRGFSVYDTWNLDRYLAQVIADSMAYLRGNCHGYPVSLPNEEAWQAILSRIEDPLRIWAEQSHDMDSDEMERWLDRCDESLGLLRQYFFDMWD